MSNTRDSSPDDASWREGLPPSSSPTSLAYLHPSPSGETFSPMTTTTTSTTTTATSSGGGGGTTTTSFGSFNILPPAEWGEDLLPRGSEAPSSSTYSASLSSPFTSLFADLTSPTVGAPLYFGYEDCEGDGDGLVFPYSSTATTTTTTAGSSSTGLTGGSSSSSSSFSSAFWDASGGATSSLVVAPSMLHEDYIMMETGSSGSGVGGAPSSGGGGSSSGNPSGPLLREAKAAALQQSRLRLVPKGTSYNLVSSLLGKQNIPALSRPAICPTDNRIFAVGTEDCRPGKEKANLIITGKMTAEWQVDEDSLQQHSCPFGPIVGLQWFDAHNLVVASGDSLHVFQFGIEADLAKRDSLFPIHTAAIREIALSPHRPTYLASAGDDGLVSVIDLARHLTGVARSGRQLQLKCTFSEAAASVCWHPSWPDVLAAATCSGLVHLLHMSPDAQAGSCLFSLSVSSLAASLDGSTLYSLAFEGEGRLLCGFGDGSMAAASLSLTADSSGLTCAWEVSGTTPLYVGELVPLRGSGTVLAFGVTARSAQPTAFGLLSTSSGGRSGDFASPLSLIAPPPPAFALPPSERYKTSGTPFRTNTLLAVTDSLGFFSVYSIEEA